MWRKSNPQLETAFLGWTTDCSMCFYSKTILKKLYIRTPTFMRSLEIRRTWVFVLVRQKRNTYFTSTFFPLIMFIPC